MSQVQVQISLVNENVATNVNGNEYLKFAATILDAQGKPTAFTATGTHYVKSTTPLRIGQVYLVEGVRVNDKGDGYNIIGFLHAPVVAADVLMSALGYTTQAPVTAKEEVLDAVGVNGDDLPF